jgi:putative transposase
VRNRRWRGHDLPQLLCFRGWRSWADSETPVHAELKAQGRGVSRGRIERLMRRHGIRAITARPQRARTTDSHHDFPIAPNLLERNFIAAAPNRIWLADITYVETDQGWLYLGTVMDLYSRKIVGWAMADPFLRRTSVGGLGDGDCDTATRCRLDPPFRSRRSIRLGGVSQDDAGRRLPALDEPQGRLLRQAARESFFDTLKTELVHHQYYVSREEARRDIFTCIEGFYNRTGRHSAIGYLSPIEMELEAA